MRIYIAYKFSNNADKEGLKRELQELSDKLISWGHETFILGRDVKKWQHVHFGTITLIPLIFKNLRKCDYMVAYVNSNVPSKGLMFEVIISKLIGKKSSLILVNGTRADKLRDNFSKVAQVDSLAQLQKNQVLD
ncbi:hypothetical protein KAZ57_03500 [Patescibacteria group bacterium]|nr:hypothetical protein [Patescibacteria group bacterium]